MLRRPPTVVQLRPSDVADMAALMKERNEAKGATTKVKDPLLDKEQKERKDKSAKTRSERIGA